MAGGRGENKITREIAMIGHERTALVDYSPVKSEG